MIPPAMYLADGEFDENQRAPDPTEAIFRLR